jgi:hypothetical protein
MRTKLNLFLGVTLFALLFSCQKEANQYLSNDSGTAVESSIVDQGLTLTANPAGDCGNYKITGSVNGNSGTLALLINGITNTTVNVSNTVGVDIDVEAALLQGLSNTIVLTWTNPQAGSPRSVSLIVNAPDCARLACTADLFASEVEYVGTNKFKVTYTVSTCELGYENVKLQGGLTANTVAGSITAGSSDNDLYQQINDKNKNTTHNWIFDIAPNSTKTFSLTFSVDPKKTFGGAGPLYPITGAWSIKQNSAPLAAYSDRIMVSK